MFKLEIIFTSFLQLDNQTEKGYLLTCASIFPNKTSIKSRSLDYIFILIFIVMCDIFLTTSIVVPFNTAVKTAYTNETDSSLNSKNLSRRLFTRSSLVSSSLMYGSSQQLPYLTPITFSVNENTPISTIIGYIPEYIYPSPTADIKFTLPNNPFFEINVKGALLVIGELDRDDNPHLCIEPGYPRECIWSSFAITTMGQYIGLRITINDLNDNIPKWPQSFIVINVQEEVKTKQDFELPLANDPDYGINSVQEYHLKTDITESKYFRLIIEKNNLKNLSSFSFHLILSVVETLDRERQAWYNLSLLAVDGSKPYNTGTLVITIHITDENDHTPVFSSPLYQAVISEDSKVGDIIYLSENNQNFETLDPLGTLSDDSSTKNLIKHQIHATDPDEGLNGEIEYTYAASTPKSVLENFELDKHTGLLYIANTLDYDVGPNEWKFQVIAKDKGRPARSSTTSVTIILSDANTHAPTIKSRIQLSENYKRRLKKLNVNFTPKNENILYIPENVPHTNEPLVFLTVSDQDTGSGGSFECELSTSENTVSKRSSAKAINNYLDKTVNQPIQEQFRLDFTAKLPKWKVYSLYAITTFDREQGQMRLLHIKCKDEGTPKMTSTYTLTVYIADENDNAPEFAEDHYKIHVMEENQPNSTVGRIVATDKDADQNGKVNYRIEWSKLYKHYESVFTLTEDGKLIATQSLDRERVPNGYHFMVIAYDSGEPSLSASTSIHVILDDINDCVPTFSQSEYNFTIDEDFMQNYTTSRIIGLVAATDCDIGLNGMLIYSILDPGLPFEINNHGLLKTNRLIDRESQSVYRFTVLVTDGGVHPQNKYTLLEDYQFDIYEEKVHSNIDNGSKSHMLNEVHTSAVSVSIHVTDLNDNAPVFVYPNTSIFKVRLSIHEKKGYIITRLVAVDKDSGPNGEIHYSLLKADPKHIFGLRHDTGEIIVTKNIEKIEESTVLSIQASDHGNPPKSSKIDVEITVGDIPPTGRSLGTLDEYQLANLKSLGLIGITELDNSGTVEMNKLIMMCIVVSTTVLCIILIFSIGIFAKRTSCRKLFTSQTSVRCAKKRNGNEKNKFHDNTCKDLPDSVNQSNELEEKLKDLKEPNSVEMCDVLSHVQYNHYPEIDRKSFLVPGSHNTLTDDTGLKHLLQSINHNTMNNADRVVIDGNIDTSTLANPHCDNPTSSNIHVSFPSHTSDSVNNNATLFMSHLECNHLVTPNDTTEVQTDNHYTSETNSNPGTSYSQDTIMTLPRICAIHGTPGTAMKLFALPLSDSSYVRCPEIHRNLCISPLNDAPTIDSDVDSGQGGSINNIGSSPNSDQLAPQFNTLSNKSDTTILPVHYVTGDLNFSLVPVSIATSLNLTSSSSSNPTILLPLSELPNTTSVSTPVNSQKHSKVTCDKLRVTFAETNTDEKSPDLTSSLKNNKNVIRYPLTISTDPETKEKGPWRLIQCASKNVRL
ncbi:unnamed protein product [Trichobilharzia szidati]|nr:unnamed protein product [Trichobilharzia szidati]